MLKRINPGDVVLGMYIHKLEGNWFSHPFWRARFLLTDPDMLDRLHASYVPAVIIDTERGIDPDAAPARAASPAPPPAPARRLLPARPAPLPRDALVSPTAPAQAGVAHVLSAPPGEVARGFGRASALAERGVKAVTGAFLEMRLGKAITPATISPVINSIITSVQTNPFAFNGLMRFRRDREDVFRHALATSALMIALGRNLRLDPIDLHAAGLAGLLLDAGICLLPVEVAPEGVDARTLPAEIWHSHVQLGHDFIVRCRLSDTVARACLEHHERIDGAGWPNAIGGNGLSKLGRMAAICDSYDTLAAGGSNPAEALRTMKADVGAFDSELLAVFEATVGVWPTGSVVALRSGRLAVVLDQNRDSPDRPLVAVFYDPANARPIDTVWIDLNTCFGADAITGAGSIDTLPEACRAKAATALTAAVERVAPAAKGGASQAA